jgi:hypothetical protein
VTDRQLIRIIRAVVRDEIREAIRGSFGAGIPALGKEEPWNGAKQGPSGHTENETDGESSSRKLAREVLADLEARAKRKRLLQTSSPKKGSL